MTDVVSVACKVPMGLNLRLFSMVTKSADVHGRTYEYKEAEPMSDFVRIHGAAYPHGQPGRIDRRTGELIPMIGGYAITRNVPEEFWNEWLKQNADTELVRNKQIFAFKSAADMKSECNNLADVRSGMERMEPDRDPRWLYNRQRISNNVSIAEAGTSDPNQFRGGF